MYFWKPAKLIPDYIEDNIFLPANFLTHFEYDQGENQPPKYSWNLFSRTASRPFKNVTNTNKFSGSDSPDAFATNLKKKPQDWHYRTKEVVYNVNANGYRAPEWDTIDWKNAVVIFGCSCTAGIGVAEDETISAYLSTILNRPVINMGVGGTSMQFALINSAILSEKFPTPYAVVHNWTTIDRTMLFRKSDINHSGPWDAESAGPFYEGFIQDRYNPILYAKYNSLIGKNLWKDRCRYYSISFFEETAHFTESDWIEIDNGARDLIHPGRGSNFEMARKIAENID